ncbi:AraC family transcriptional regulator [Lactonifactor longoviformis]|uniref:AraC family transcriptional regulator n=1 Tax=Lactonifactor longoviformis TaxID=341220 RepID=UPI003F736211
MLYLTVNTCKKKSNKGIEERYMDKKKLVNQSIDYIMLHLNENWSLNTVAAHFFISKYQFIRIFKEETSGSVYL